MLYDVLLCGDYWYDLIFTDLPGLPQLGREVLAGGFDQTPGGPFIHAVAMHRLGLRVGWAADFGNDPFSRSVIKAARREGLDEALFQCHARPYRRITAAASFPSDRAFLSYSDRGPEIPAPLIALAEHNARVLMIPGLCFGPRCEEFQARARARGMKIVMDCQCTDETLDNPAVRRALERVDVFLPNSSEARQLTGAPNTLAALCYLGDVCSLVVIKDGPDGAHAICNGETFYAPAIPVKVVDTTGAGDAFGAGFLKAWLDGKPIAECLRWGNICGGLSTTARGGASATPTLKEVEKWLKGKGRRMKDKG
jgi:sugar/nucleoside kinase (ribokinase family)